MGTQRWRVSEVAFAILLVFAIQNVPGRRTRFRPRTTYDTNGNLASVTYPNISTPGPTPPAVYTYDGTHLYKSGTDPRGNLLPSTTYDTGGRLQSVTVNPDANTSYTTSYAYDTTTPVTGGT